MNNDRNFSFTVIRVPVQFRTVGKERQKDKERKKDRREET
jgi:hypothetical protein